LLPKCGKYPAKNSVIVMDNAPIHHSESIRQLCADAGVILVYLPPYSPDYNPIEEFISEVKAFVKEYWRLYLETTDRSHQAFRQFLAFCVLEVGQRSRSAQGHYFENAGFLCE
jgi:transposase